jgi:hypothetical protein
MLNVPYRVLHNTRYKISPHLLTRFAVNHNPHIVHAKISSVGRLILIMFDYCVSITDCYCDLILCLTEKKSISIIKINNGVCKFA